MAYEYKINVRHDMESVYRDSYKNFGWKLEKSK